VDEGTAACCGTLPELPPAPLFAAAAVEADGGNALLIACMGGPLSCPRVSR